MNSCPPSKSPEISARPWHRGLSRASLFLTLLVIAILAVGCKKSVPATTDVATAPSATSAQSNSSSGSPSQGVSPVNGSDQPGSLADRLNAVQSGHVANSGPALPAWKPLAPGTSTPSIPLQANLLVVTAVSAPDGDYESMKQITAVTPTAATMQYSAETPPPQKINPATGIHDIGAPQPKGPLRHVSCARLIDIPDLAHAHAYAETFCGTSAKVEHYPGSTAITASTEVLNQLRSGQPSDFSIQASDLTQIFQLFGHMQPGQTTPTVHPGQIEGTSWCSLKRAESTDLAFPVTFNDQPVVLPALHASCVINEQEDIDIYLLDQPSNPIVLAFQIDNSRLQVIRITLPPPPPPPAATPPPPSQMESALAAKKAVQVYGIYFDFNSATLKPESEAVLKQISDILRKNPDWKLNVSGHTDNIGDDTFNLSLSQRRAAAVKDALVTRYRIAADRLATDGFGASRPIESNTTLEGRARNRRVELQRQ